MKKILVAVDGSNYSQKALFKAKDIALAMGSEVTILNVVNYLKDSALYMNNREVKAELTKTALKQSDDILKSAKEIFKDFPGTVLTSYRTGDAVDEIIKYAEEGKFDLVIMGSRGVGIFSRTLLGSVSDKVVHHIKTSVLIVK